MHENFHALIRGERKGLWPAILRLGLWMLSLPYAAGVRLRNRAFDRGWRTIESVSIPVISVGNLTAGGTGKTPCVEYVAGFYRRRDVRVAVLSRGYGSEAGPNDEALVLEENLADVPHLQGRDRVAMARIAIEELTKRYPALELAAPPTRRPLLVLRGFESIPVRARQGAARSAA